MCFGEHREEAVDRPDGDTGPVGDRETGFADPHGLVQFADRQVVGGESRVRRNHGMDVTRSFRVLRAREDPCLLEIGPRPLQLVAAEIDQAGEDEQAGEDRPLVEGSRQRDRLLTERDSVLPVSGGIRILDRYLVEEEAEQGRVQLLGEAGAGVEVVLAFIGLGGQTGHHRHRPVASAHQRRVARFFCQGYRLEPVLPGWLGISCPGMEQQELPMHSREEGAIAASFGDRQRSLELGPRLAPPTQHVEADAPVHADATEQVEVTAGRLDR